MDQTVEESSNGTDHDATAENKEQQSRYKEGQILQFVRVRFPGHTKSLPFLIGRRKLAYGQKVVAMSDRGMTVGYINSFPYEAPFTQAMHPVRSISRAASDEDIEEQRNHYKREKEVETLCIDLVEKHNLDMNITHVEFTQFGKKVVFYFNAPQRVDFRGLVKDLVSELKMRIELRQISVRDRSAAIGGIGPCGLQLCCSSFLTRYGSVNIKMAKNQNLTLIQSKLNGVCGQLKCCMRYEDEAYSQIRKRFPKEYDIIGTKSGEKGKVLRLNLMEQYFEMLTDRGIIKRYSISMYDPKKKLPDDYQFPEKFDHVSRETGEVIGLNEFKQEKIETFDQGIQRYFDEDQHLAHQYFNFLTPEQAKEDQVMTPTTKDAKLVYSKKTDKFLWEWQKDLVDDFDYFEASEEDLGEYEFDEDDDDSNQDMNDFTGTKFQYRGRDESPNAHFDGDTSMEKRTKRTQSDTKQSDRGPNRSRNNNQRRRNNSRRRGRGRGGNPQSRGGGQEGGKE